MTTSEVEMDGTEILEGLLERAYAADLSSDRQAELGERITRAIARRKAVRLADATAAASNGPNVGRRFARRRLALVPVALIALIVMVAATSGLLSKYESLGSYAWQHGVQIGQSRTIDGYRVTLERAYVDANLFAVYVSAVDERDRWDQVSIFNAKVSDADGTEWWPASGSSMVADVTASANALYFYSADGLARPGSHVFMVTIPAISVRDPSGTGDAVPSAMFSAGTSPQGYSNPWREIGVDASFSLSLDVAAGTEVDSAGQATSDGITAKADRILISPSTVRVDLTVTAASGRQAGIWSKTPSLGHNGQDLDVASGYAMFGNGDTTSFLSARGASDPSGSWRLAVSEVDVINLAALPTDAVGDIPEDHYSGPWVIEFTVS